MRAVTTSSGPRCKPALVSVIPFVLAASAAVFCGGCSGNGSRSPVSASTGSRSPHSTATGSVSASSSPTDSVSPQPLSTDDPALAADWTATPTDIGDEIPTGGAFGYSSTTDFGSAMFSCAQDQGFAGNEEFQPSFPLAETRAEFTAAVVENGSASAGFVEVCIGHNGDNWHGAYRLPQDDTDFGSGTGAAFPAPGNDGVDLIVLEVGQVQPDVAKTTFTLTDGSVVTATIGGGWAFAWWPGSATASTVTAYAADGSVINVLQPEAPADWPPPSPLTPLPAR